jgi:hypothetical protein
MKISCVICGRNDNYGGFLNERAEYSINSMLDEVDEVIYVDWNGFDKPLTDVISIKDRQKLKVIVVSPEKCKELMGEEKYNSAQKVCEVLARNIGIRRATGDVIISTNPDVIFPKRYLIDYAVSKLKEDEMLTLTKHDVELSELDKHFKKNIDIEMLPVIFGLNSITNRIMSPFVSINKDIIERFPEDKHHTLASIICACGDFQMAHKSMWYKIRGFEENTVKRSYTDTQVQYKVIMAGGTVKTSTFPPVYHIEHIRDNNPNIQNSMDMVKTTHNLEDWGYYNIL